MGLHAKYIILTLLLLLPVTAGRASAQTAADNATQIPDSLVSAQYVYYYSMSDPELARGILDELRRRGAMPGYEIDMVEGAYHANNRNFRLASFFYERAMQNDTLRLYPDEYATALTHSTFPYIELQSYDKVVEYLNESIKITKETGNQMLQGESYMVFAIILHSQNDKEKAYEYFQAAADALEQFDGPTKYARLFDVYTNMALHKVQDEEYKQAYEILSRVPDIINNIDPVGLPENLIASSWKDYYNYRALVLHGLGDSAGALKSYEQWTKMDSVNGLNDYLIAHYLIESRQYDEAIEYCRSLDVHVEERPLSNAAVISAQTRAKVHELRNEPEQAVKYYKQLVAIKDSIKVREQRSEALQYATIYETQRKDAEILRQTITLENQKKRLRIWVALAITSIAALFVIVLILRSKRAAYKALAEKTQNWAKDGNMIPAENAGDGDDGDSAGRSDEPTPQDRRIMKKVRMYVEDQFQYRNPSLTLDTLAAELSENKKYISTAINRIVRNNFNAYVNELRVKEAIRLLLDKKNSDVSIDEISERAGFNNRGSFYEWFKKYSGLTPTQFRRSI